MLCALPKGRKLQKTAEESLKMAGAGGRVDRVGWVDWGEGWGGGELRGPGWGLGWGWGGGHGGGKCSLVGAGQRSGIRLAPGECAFKAFSAPLLSRT